MICAGNVKVILDKVVRLHETRFVPKGPGNRLERVANLRNASARSIANHRTAVSGMPLTFWIKVWRFAILEPGLYEIPSFDIH